MNISNSVLDKILTASFHFRNYTFYVLLMIFSFFGCSFLSLRQYGCRRKRGTTTEQQQQKSSIKKLNPILLETNYPIHYIETKFEKIERKYNTTNNTNICNIIQGEIAN